MTQNKRIGWSAAVISLAASAVIGFWPEGTSYSELRVFPWVFGPMWLLAVLGSMVAGLLLSRRWYYLTILWLTVPIVTAFGIWWL